MRVIEFMEQDRKQIKNLFVFLSNYSIIIMEVIL